MLDSMDVSVADSDDAFEVATADAARLVQLSGGERHEVAVVLGSGWGDAASELGATDVEIDFSALRGFPAPTVKGHAGSIRSVRAGDKRVLLMLGRPHLYEGHAASVVVHPVRTAILAGCRVVVLTNAAGALREDLPIGSPVLVADHLNLTGHNPLRGPDPPPPHPPRFCDMTSAYSPGLRALARATDPSLAEGVYAGLLGPSYETPAEIRMLRTIGADLVGMSTVLETIAAAHLGAEVLAISLVTNLAAGLQGRPLDHAEVLQAGQASATRMARLIRGVVGALPG